LGALQEAGPGLKEDRALVLEAVSKNGVALWHAGPGLRQDRELVLEAVRQDGLALMRRSTVRHARARPLRK
jgi:hypothetical protein